MRILATASPFAFGPADTLVTLANALQAAGHQLTILAEGSAAELISLSTSLRSVTVALDTPDGKATARRFAAEADVVISVMDGRLLSLAGDAPPLRVWIDTLSAFPDMPLPREAQEADLVLIQRSLPGTVSSRNAGASPASIPVAPILRTGGRRATPRGPVLVNLGGLRLPTDWSDTVYTAALGATARFLKHLSGLCDSALDVVGGAVGLARAGERLGRSIGSIRTLSAEQFQSALGSASALVTPPGLNTPLAAWSLGVPTLLMPPMNPSQVRHLTGYAASEALPDRSIEGFALPDWYFGSLPEVLRSFVKDDNAHDLAALFARVLNGPSERRQDLVRRGRMFTAALGSDGAAEAVSIIVQYAEARRAGRSSSRVGRPATDSARHSLSPGRDEHPNERWGKWGVAEDLGTVLDDRDRLLRTRLSRDVFRMTIHGRQFPEHADRGPVDRLPNGHTQILADRDR